MSERFIPLLDARVRQVAVRRRDALNLRWTI